jgi:hypothetical protein
MSSFLLFADESQKGNQVIKKCVIFNISSPSYTKRNEQTCSKNERSYLALSILDSRANDESITTACGAADQTAEE